MKHNFLSPSLFLLIILLSSISPATSFRFHLINPSTPSAKLLSPSSSSISPPKTKFHLSLPPPSLLAIPSHYTTLSVNNPLAWASLAVFGGATSSPVTLRATRSWYKKIKKPRWTPPNKLFAPVWTLLYATIGISACNVFVLRKKLGYKALSILITHYFFNLSWSWTFFGFRRPFVALLINFFLVPSLARVMFLFNKVNKTSAYLLTPYFMWLSFATVLNGEVVRLNPGGFRTSDLGFGKKLPNKEISFPSLLTTGVKRLPGRTPRDLPRNISHARKGKANVFRVRFKLGGVGFDGGSFKTLGEAEERLRGLREEVGFRLVRGEGRGGSRSVVRSKK